MKIYSRRNAEFDLEGDLLTGAKTYDYQKEIKTYLGGKWDAAARGYRVDLAKVEKTLDINNVFRRTRYE